MVEFVELRIAGAVVVDVVDEGVVGIVVWFVMGSCWGWVCESGLFEVGRVEDWLHEEECSELVELVDCHDIKLFSERGCGCLRW